MDANSQQAKYLSRKTVKFFREKKNSNGIKQNNRISVCKKKMCFVHFMWYYETCSNRGIWSMADYIDNSCHIDQTTNVIDEVDILGTYATIQNHQNDEISTSSTILVSICAVPINIFFFFYYLHYLIEWNRWRSRLAMLKLKYLLGSHRKCTQHLDM